MGYDALVINRIHFKVSEWEWWRSLLQHIRAYLYVDEWKICSHTHAHISNRIHFKAKTRFKKEKRMEFLWRGDDVGERGGARGIFSRLMRLFSLYYTHWCYHIGVFFSFCDVATTSANVAEQEEYCIGVANVWFSLLSVFLCVFVCVFKHCFVLSVFISRWRRRRARRSKRNT
jgi:hypothetical protein